MNIYIPRHHFITIFSFYRTCNTACKHSAQEILIDKFGKIAQSMKCLSNKQEDHCSVPQSLCICILWLYAIAIPLFHWWLANQAFSVSSRTMRDVSKYKKDEEHSSLFSGLYMHEHIYAPIHTHAHTHIQRERETERETERG